MRHPMRSITWKGRAFRFDRMIAPWLGDPSDWAVSSGLEFIGTMTCGTRVTTGEFDVQCVQWLNELLG
jgi:hypothetical protein